MAVFRCAMLLSPPPLLPPHFSRGRVSSRAVRCSSVSPLFPSKSSKRKNYLRPKILRTLNPKPSETTSIEIEVPESAPPNDVFSDQSGSVEELQVSSSSVVSDELNGMSGKLSPKSVANYGLYLVGVFVFQTVCAVWFLGNSTNSRKRLEISNDIGSSSSKILLNGSGNSSNEINGLRAGNLIYLDKLEMNEKITEIRAMARDARKSEQKDGKKSEFDEGMSTSGLLDIEKEIGAKLSYMEKRLNSQRKGLAGLSVSPMDKFGNGEGKRSDLDIEDDEKSLTFEKKYKFKAEKPPSNAKGFGGIRGNRGKSGRNANANDLLNNEKKSEEMKNQKGAADPEIMSGAVQENNERPSSNQVKKSRSSLSSRGNGNIRRNGSERQSGKENGFWWLKLPYVLRILMRSNIDEEVSEGFFILRTESADKNETENSYVVAFEDQNDARNFCYLLESVFEDLGGFCTDIVPASTKDLLKEVSLSGKKVIVVKKRQLTLYAGQPFEDVERALHSLIQEQ